MSSAVTVRLERRSRRRPRLAPLGLPTVGGTPLIVGDDRHDGGAPVAVDDHGRRLRSRHVRILRREAVVVAQDAAGGFATRDRCRGIGVLVRRSGDRGDQPVVEALMVALEMVVLDELRDREAEVALAKRNELVQALGFDRMPRRNPSTRSATLRATCWSHASCGWRIRPAMRTRRESRSITTRRRSARDRWTSTVKKSVAAITPVYQGV